MLMIIFRSNVSFFIHLNIASNAQLHGINSVSNTQSKTSDPSPYLSKTKITGSENNKLEVLLINRGPLRTK